MIVHTKPIAGKAALKLELGGGAAGDLANTKPIAGKAALKLGLVCAFFN